MVERPVSNGKVAWFKSRRPLHERKDHGQEKEDC